MRRTSVRYTPMRCMPMRYTHMRYPPMRYMHMRYTPIRCTPMPPRSSVVPALPDDPEARIVWAMRHRERFKGYWGKDCGFVNKAVAVR